MTINLGKVSQILAAVVNSSYLVGHILIEVKNISTSLDMSDEPNSQELQKDFLCKTSEDVDTLRTTSEREKLEIEEFSAYPLCTFEINNSGEGDLHDMIKEGEHQNYIESWFQKVTWPQYHSFIQHLLIQKQVSQFIFHIQVIPVTTFSYLDKGIFLI